MKRSLLLVIILLTATACTQAAGPAAEPTALAVEDISTRPVERSTPVPTVAPPTLTPVPTTASAQATATATGVAAVSEPTVSAVTETPAATGAPVIVAGKTDDGAYFFGAVDAPITLIDYSDFLWSACRAYVLGTGREVIDEYVMTGRVKLVFWPVLNHGNPSLYSTATAECVAQQSPEAFWQIHETLFQNQFDLWTADRDYYLAAAQAVGVDRTQFEQCYDSGAGVAYVMSLDEVRRIRGIYSQPVFDVNGQLLYGAQSFATMSELIEAALAAE